MHHVCKFLETSAYVRVLLIVFSKAFHVVNHVSLIRKILALDMPTNINNWLISFLTVAHGSVNLVCQFHLAYL